VQRKVIGSNVTDLAGKKIGRLEDVVLDKQSNSILFAVVGFGGFFGEYGRPRRGS
jgi:uncharacterized protein YrrD